MFDRAAIIEERFLDWVTNGTLPQLVNPLTLEQAGLIPADLSSFFETQLMIRHTDFLSRRSKGKTFYSIGASGHDGMAAVAAAARPTDMAFLHYRDTAFQLQRQSQIGNQARLHDLILSFAAAKEDPVSGGRHKVLGGKAITIPPQTSTIASHLPKAVGAAHSIALAGDQGELPKDSIIICSFGDASANHSTAQGAINAALWASYQHSPMPIVFVCEDNDIGISVRTPLGWTQSNFEHRPGLKYFHCDGTHLPATYQTAHQAIDYARARRRPVFLHVKTVRLMGHAGADIEAAYTPTAKLDATEKRDPLLVTAALLKREGIATREQLLALNEAIAGRVNRIANRVFTRPKLTSAKAVMASLVPTKSAHKPAKPLASQTARAALFSNDKRLLEKPQPLAKQITLALADTLLQYDNALIFGEDLARKGGVYGVTAGLLNKFGPRRVQDTLLDEQTILGLAIGAAHNGFVPIPEIQFLAYLHNAEDQLRGEAATLSFFSDSQFTNPMVIRIAGLGYQKGFGGHFHNDNSFNVLRDIPGLIVACPSAPEDAAPMLRTCMALAHEQRRVVVFLEPIALYQTADLHQEGDKAWLAPYIAPADQKPIRLGEIGVHGNGTDLCFLTYGNGHYLSRKAAKALGQDGVKSRVIDLRWLQPLDIEAILKAVKPCKNILIVDECRQTGSLSEQLMTMMQEHGVTAPAARICAKDSFIPLGSAAYEMMPSEEDIIAAARQLLKGSQ